MNNTVISRKFTLWLCTPHNRSFDFSLNPRTFPNNRNPFTRNQSRIPKLLSFCSITSSESLGYGGWDTPQLFSDSVGSGESNHLHRLLNSLGINDKKHVSVFVLGFVCALAISRVKVSSFIAFPACMVVFVLGFTIGLVNGGKMSSFGAKNMAKDGLNGVPVDKLSSLEDVIKEFGAKIVNLKNDVKKSIESNYITVGDLECFINNLESVNSLTVNARGILDNCIIIRTQEVERSSNQKQSRRKKDPRDNQFGIPWFFSGLFREKPDLKYNKVKVPKDDELMDGNILGSSTYDRNKNNILKKEASTRSNPDADGNANPPEMDYTTFGSRQYGYWTNSSQYIRNQRISLNNVYPKEDGIWTSDEFLSNSMEFSETVSSFRQEEEVTELKGNYSMFNGPKMDEEDHGKDDINFNKYISEANALLEEAKSCLQQKGDDKIADGAFQKSALVLSKATHIRPVSSLAVGLLGNTYLLHGELKLRISRELRMLLLTRANAQSNKFGRKEEIASYLGNVCEECEELLIKAGRQYKLALSIDGNDMRVLYNWGLALNFRAQLIADIGPGAARDADKVFMAAIDKFDAMMSKSNDYAPDALFRWGAALQQRSRLRPKRSKEKVKLLQQARRLYEDALGMDSGNVQVQKALSSCISELNWFN
ncbi:unnamed protein product [Cuscuta epithymum]|uniref:Uncharacterized protein n=1 Tax=Cuscuta epithymum TaxID=186058 RepID=A0AAV0EHB1_9ASTE|nr:unnamed protein product [Cuscuta epithymum]